MFRLKNQNIIKKRFLQMKIPEKEDLQFLTGVENSQLFMWLLDVIKPNISLIVQHFGYENHLFLVCLFENHLIEIWLFDSTSMSQSVKSLSKMDKISVSFIKEFDLCLDIEATRKKLPSSFRRFPNCVCIMDCTEIFTERQQNQLA